MRDEASLSTVPLCVDCAPCHNNRAAATDRERDKASVMSGHAIYLRVKRRNQTFCFLCEDTDTVLDVKRKVLAAVSQHKEDGSDSSNDGPSSAESLQLLLPAGPKQPQQQEDDNADDDDDEEMMDDGDDNNSNRRRKSSSFLKDDDTLASVRGKAAASSPGKEAAEEAELLLHVVFPVADNEWEPVDVAPTVIQDS